MNNNKEFPRKKSVEKQLDYLYGVYCPQYGPSKTYGGELIRAMNRVLYKWQTERTMLGSDETLEKSGVIINEFAHHFGVEFIANKYFYGEKPDDEEYEYNIYSDIENLLKAVFENPEIFKKTSDYNIDE